MIDSVKRVGIVLLVPFALFAFASMLIGPDRVGPWIESKLGIRSPDPVRPIPVDRAQEVIYRANASIRAEEVEARINYFADRGSRIPGYPGHEETARYIESEFRRNGLVDVRAEEYHVTAPVDEGGSLRLESGERIPIHGVWPNLIKTSTLPPGGVRTHLVYGGHGEFSDFDGFRMEGAAVLMEFNSWNNWLNAATLGARQIIFIEPDTTSYSEAEQKFLQVPNSVERFWVSRKDGDRLKSLLSEQGEVSVHLTSRMIWQKAPARNIIGTIAGTDSVLKDRLVVINAYYDAMSVVPALAPGAEMAGGIVGLLELIEYFSAHPPKHTVMFLASSGHHMGFRGICDFLSRHSRKEKHFAKLMTEPFDIRLFISLDLTSQTNEIGVWNSTRTFYYKRFFTPFGRSFTRYSKSIAEGLGLDPKDAMIDGVNPKGGMTWDMYIPGEQLKTDGEVVLDTGTPSLSLITVNDARFRFDTPLDRAEYVNIENLTGQIRLIAGVLDLGLNSPDLIPDYRLDPDDRMRGLKGFVRTFPRRSIVPDRPKAGAIASLRMGIEKSVKGVRRIYYDLADENGEFYMPGIAERRVRVSAYYLDPVSGEITYAPNFGQQARIYRGEFDMDWWISKRTMILFPCVTTDFYDTVDPRYLTKLEGVSIYNEANTTPQEYGYAIGFGPDEPVGTIFTPPGERVKVAMRTGFIGIRYLLLNSTSAETEELARGKGFQTLTHGSFVRSSFQALSDMWRLNEARMNELKSYSIQNHRLNVLHEQARYHLDQAAAAERELRWGDYIRHTRAGLGIEARAYPDVKETQNDVIRGIMFFMLLVIPCAFFTERLLITASDIRWQLVGFATIFLLIWMFLWQVHPAFELSSPFVILLAFVIFALAIFVIGIVFARFSDNMKRLKRAESLVHDTDVGRISASVAAFQLGIANMKRRPLRTALTFTTLLILTFTVLSFTSIKASLQFHQILRDSEGPYGGILVRSKFWGPLEDAAYDYAKVNFGDVATITPRSWYITRNKKKTPVETQGKSHKTEGVLGLSAKEPLVTGVDSFLVAGRWFEEDEEAIILPDTIADKLALTADSVGVSRVRIFGKQLLLVGIVDAEGLNGFFDLDEERITPADFKLTDDEEIARMTQVEEREKQGLERPEVEIMPFEHMSAANIAILPYGLLRDIGSPLQSVAVRFNPGIDVEAQVKAFLTRLSVVLFAGIPDATGRIQVSVFSSMGDTSLSGLSGLFIPILVAALIVLNTMMGSVYERFKEIGIYSAVGLAPVHISFLFIAEACVYAVLGAVSGYLVGQGVAKLLLWQGWLEGVTLNYSALSTVASSGLVMLVVILSTLYPARKAAQMAVPDVARRWRLPVPDGDSWRFEFPFTVGGADVFGLSVFLTEYFASHEGESMGTFYTDGATFASFESPKGEAYSIETAIWLAPYDLGVSQRVRFEARPTGEHHFYALTVGIERVSGDRSSWLRVNQGFVNGLRKQFLIWRTVAPEDRETFKQKGLKMLGRDEEKPVTIDR
jgi:hypothetical protein